MRDLVIFHSPTEPQASPAVCGTWLRPPVELLAESGAVGGFGNNVSTTCTQFVAWCCARQPEVVWHLAVLNLPGIPWGRDVDSCAWYEQLMKELSGWQPPPVLVNVDAMEVTQGGTLLWRPERQGG